MFLFKNCSVVKTGHKWIEIKSDSNRYKTNVKILKESAGKIIEGGYLLLEHIEKEKFRNITDDEKILELRIEDIKKYFKNAIRKYIYRFLREYEKFRRDYEGNERINEVSTYIDTELIKYSELNNVNLSIGLSKKYNPVFVKQAKAKAKEEREAKARKNQEIIDNKRKEILAELDKLFFHEKEIS